MDFLEDILQQHGVAGDYWATARAADRDAPRDEAWDEFMSLVADLPESEQLALLNKSIMGNQPTYLLIAKIYTERGDGEAAAKAYEKAYRSVLENYPDSEDLSRLGYLLLKHCGVDELPLCAEDFGLTLIEFDDNDTLYLAPQLYDPKLPEFPEKAQTLTMAICAFGLAWVYYKPRYQHGISKSEAWHELLALEGLRAAFRETGDLDALDKVCDYFLDAWLGYWEDTLAGLSLIEPFVANFRATAAYLQGRRETAPSSTRLARYSGSDLLATQRLLSWQLRELLAEVRDKQITPEVMESLAAHISEAIAEKIEGTPDYIIKEREQRLAQELGKGWHRLPIDVRRLLIQAEYLRSVLHRAVDADWAPAVLQYVRAIETLLRMLGKKLDARNLHIEWNSGYSYARANIERFRNLFQNPQIVQLAGAAGLSGGALMAELGPRLDEIIKSYRNPAVHGAEPMSPVKVTELRNMLFGSGDPGGDLLWIINSLCTSD